MKLAGWRFSFGLATAILFSQGQHEAQATSKAANYLPEQLDLAFGIEAMTGDTTYTVGGAAVYADGTNRNDFFRSELEWPLDIWLARLNAGWTFSPEWRIGATLKGNFSDPDERMIDRDWLTLPGRLDVYSESEVSSLDVLIFDIDLEYTFWQKGLWTMYAGAGYRHQNFQYESALLFQYSPSGLPGCEQYGFGSTTASYDVTYSMPYLLLGSEYQLTPQLRLTGSLAFAPLISADDETVLLLRGKTGEGDMDGVAGWAELSGIYYLTPWWFLEVGLHHAWIDVDGEQHQVLNEQPLGRFDMETESRQTSGHLSVGYSF